ncbi:unnamed protein product [Microthlaspi erraticum]|uniref:Reverse transcriptase domain-containing protein n=1 Tax=Microthlaspi erraticum TaxID=1685480 RepID=A0A6D2K079_9BRAS|nr:unnamed protein product [Microthlaspi erraticum]
MHKKYHPGLIFLSETKNKKSVLQGIQVDLGYDSLFTVEPHGLSGGLALLCMDEFQVNVIFSNNRMIDVEAVIDGNKVFMTFVYGDPVQDQRELVWERLTRFAVNRNGPWFMIGDFNEICGHHEKQGGRTRPDASFLPFNQMIHDCGMLEFPCSGNQLSWVGRRGRTLVRCRLDRALGNEDWHESFPHSNVQYLRLWGSDHRPVLANILSKPIRRRKSFRFDRRWLDREEISAVVQDGWSSSLPPDANLMTRISSVRKALGRWRSQNDLNAEKHITELKDKLDSLYSDGNATTEEISEATKELHEALRSEELFWKQKSRVLWLREGDRNSKFFHAATKQRRARNRITSLIDEQGQREENEEGIVAIATRYFRGLFETSNPVEIEATLDKVKIVITDNMNETLTKPVTENEVKDALFAMHPEKTPGPDGMTALFYQKFWDILKQDITRMVNEFLAEGTIVPGINETNICLIPKKEKPQEMSQFRPISLCNVSYKIISKLLCQRLKRILPKFISETQSAFVAGRQITDNILIAQELFHALRTNPGGRNKRMAIKTDMSKAYDRVEWDFIEAVMRKMGFAETWIRWIMRCITSVSYHVLINGQPRGNIIPKRGLRQGDPLSPFIFIICTEVLIALLNEAENGSKITGMRVARASPPVSHLLFADDSLFFCKAEPRECSEVLSILHKYGKASGQRINFEKSSLLFGKRVPGSTKTHIKSITGIQNEGGMGTYLGIPEDISGSKCKLFAYIKERLQNRVNGWRSKWLSKGGKEILIKSVALALPTYVMSSFLLPLEVCDQLTSAIARFWWSSDAERRGIHWATWDKMCISKEEGGTGFRDIHDFNLALLAKQLWRLLRFPDSLLARVLRGKYFPYSTPLRAGHTDSPSYGWRSILAARPLLTMGILQKVHSGLNTRAWEDPWIPTIPARHANPRIPVVHPRMTVSDFINREIKAWNVEMLEEYMEPEDIPLIRSIAINKTFHMDSFSWGYTKSGLYTVKSGYWVAKNLLNPAEETCSEPSIRPLQVQAWKSKAPYKIKHLLWQIISGYLAVTKNLNHRGMRCDNHCPRCGAPEETINHAIFECPPALQTWALAPILTPPSLFPSSGIYTNMDYLFWRRPNMDNAEDDCDPFPWIIWFIWKARNEKLFRGINRDPLGTVRHAVAECRAWHQANSKAPLLSTTGTQAIRLRDVCIVDGSWHREQAHSGAGWIWIDPDGTQRLLGIHNQPRRISPLHAELEALMWAMECAAQYTNVQAFATDCQDVLKMIEKPEDWPKFSTELQEFSSLRKLFSSFSISYLPRASTSKADHLAKLARLYPRSLSFVGYSVPGWVTTPTRV